MNKWIRISLSVWIVFHLLVVVVSPNPGSVVHRNLEFLIAPYGNFFGINNTWIFFSPNPQVRILEYEARSFNEEGDVVREETHRLPESREAVQTREGYNRRLNFAMMVTSRPDVVEQVMAPLLCRLQPWAQEVTLFHVYREFPTIEKARLYIGGRDDLSVSQRTLIKDHRCHGGEL